MKKYVVDLALPSEDRWNDLLEDPWAIDIAKKLAFESYKDCDYGILNPFIKFGVYILAKIFGQEYLSDMYVWGKYAINDVGVAIFANLSYELSQASNRLLCSSVAFEHKKFGMIHLRNLDWSLDGMKEGTVILDYINGPCGDFQAVSLPGQVGVLSGVAKDRFSATINLAPASEVIIKNNRWVAQFLLRYIFENCFSYSDALSFLATAKTVGPTFIQLVGVNSGEACTIETMPQSPNMIHFYNQEPLAITNHYKHLTEQDGLNEEEVEWSEERLIALEMYSSAYNFNKLSDGFKVLDKYPLNHELTTQRMVLCAQTGGCLVRT
jgi:predicted choloylglycine hydrolase